MHPRVFLNELDDQRIVAAIGRAEQLSSGEIRVFISHREVNDAVEEAKAQFLHLGMEKTRERNGVLLYFAPVSQKFAVVGDVGVHEKCGDDLWSEVAATMESHLRARRFTEALLAGLERIGGVLARHFPHRPDDQNELPDQIEGD